MALTDKEENFCQLFVQYGNATKAYAEAYNPSEKRTRGSIGVDACLLKKKPHVKARIDEIREELKEEFSLTVFDMIRELDEARELALSDPKGAAAAVAATNAKAKLLGFMIDKHEHTGKDGGPIESKTVLDVSGMSEEELAVLAKALERK